MTSLTTKIQHKEEVNNMGFIKKLLGLDLEPKVILGNPLVNDSLPEVGVRIHQYFFGKPTPQVVTISFQVGGPEWCKLEQGDEWLNFEAALTALQKEQEHYLSSWRAP